MAVYSSVPDLLKKRRKKRAYIIYLKCGILKDQESWLRHQWRHSFAFMRTPSQTFPAGCFPACIILTGKVSRLEDWAGIASATTSLRKAECVLKGITKPFYPRLKKTTDAKDTENSLEVGLQLTSAQRLGLSLSAGRWSESQCLHAAPAPGPSGRYRSYLCLFVVIPWSSVSIHISPD